MWRGEPEASASKEVLRICAAEIGRPYDAMHKANFRICSATWIDLILRLAVIVAAFAPAWRTIHQTPASLPTAHLKTPNPMLAGAERGGVTMRAIVIAA